MRIPRSLLTPLGCCPILPFKLFWTAHLEHVPLTRFIINVNLAKQSLSLFEKAPPAFQRHGVNQPWYTQRTRFRISTSRHGAGQKLGSNQTPLGLHRIAVRAGAGWPTGTAFESRKPVGLTWDGLPQAPIAHRILWLEGLQPGFNRGNGVDTYSRYIYIHGIGDEGRLGRPNSLGCIHMAAADLLPFFDLIPGGTLTWIG